MASNGKNFDWVQILDPKSRKMMYVNLVSGDCRSEAPESEKIKPISADQWWELYDPKEQRNYYYNCTTRETIWQKPTNADIVPLANVQLLQQHPQSLFRRGSEDLGVLRRSASRGATIGDHAKRSQHRKFPTSVLECSTKNENASNGSANIISLSNNHSKDDFQLGSNSCQSAQQPYPPSSAQLVGNHRIRNWLRESEDAWGSSSHRRDVQRKESADINTGVAKKDKGCLSDRPVRRNCHLSTVHDTVNDPSAVSGLSNTSGPLFLLPDAVHARVGGGSGERNTTGIGVFGANHSGNPSFPVITGLTNDHSLYILTDSDGQQHDVQLLRQSTPVGVQQLTSTTFTPVMPHVQQPQNVFPPHFVRATNVSVQPLMQKRAFPRTNPTVSRNGRISRDSVLSSDQLRSINCCTSTAPMPIHNAKLNSNPLTVGSSSSSSLFRNPSSTANSTEPITIQCEGNSYISPESSRVISRTEPFPTNSISIQSLSRVDQSPINASPLSDSPQPSSSVSSSFSRSSSGTALTNTNSEDGQKETNINPSAVCNEERVHSTQELCEFHSKDINSCSPCADLDDSLQPPVPPPRSASTLGAKRLHQLDVGPEFCLPTSVHHANWQFGSNASALQQFIPFSAVDNVISMNSFSSLSRKNPTRAHVIQPNHRRLPPFSYYIPQQPHQHANITDSQSPSLYPSAPNGTVVNMSITQTSVHDSLPSPNGEVGGIHKVAVDTSTVSCVPNALQPSSVAGSSPPCFISITSSWNGVSETASPSTMTTWTSRSTSTWDGNMDGQKMYPHPLTRTIGSETADIRPSALPTLLPRRSASGGFIGPEELTESVWVHASERYSSRTSINREPVWCLVQPDDLEFTTFNGPYNWPKQLFKPDQDPYAIMSWTKSNFSKRILVSTDANQKKDAARTFKIIQSFMGDRKARLSLPDYGSIIIYRALNNVNLRDEIYSQLCKQTTCNPDVKSLTNGWAMLCVCLFYFPPSNKFRDHLQAYLIDRAQSALICSSVSSTQPSNDQNPRRIESSLEAASVIASGFAPPSLSQRQINNDDRRIGSNRPSTIIGNRLSDLVKLPPATRSTNGIKSGSTNKSQPDSTTKLTQKLPQSCTYAIDPWDKPTAAHFAHVAPRWFLRSLTVVCRKLEAPSVEEICHVKDLILKPNIFGSSLEEMMHMQVYRFPKLRIPWIQIFLTEELLRMNGSGTEGIFRLSHDVDLLSDIRCQLERLFEIFRVVQVCGPDPVASSDGFNVVHPPPSGWAYKYPISELLPDSVEAVSIKSGNSTDLEHTQVSENGSDWDNKLKSSDPFFSQCVQLTGTYMWPLLPEPLTTPPAECILLTPTSRWPRSLLSMVQLSSLKGVSGSQNADPHLAAGLLKLWLRELAEPLVPTSLQPMCLKLALEAEAYELQDDAHSTSEVTEESNPIVTCCQLVRQIPVLERRSFLYLILLLQHLAKPENVNNSLMDARNLATIFAPNLLRNSTGDPKQLLENIRPQTLFIRLLITYLDIDIELKQLCIDEQQDGTTSSGECGYACRPPARVKVGSDNSFIPL